MKNHKGVVCALIVLALSLVASASAPKGKKQTVNLFSETVVAGSTLKAGEYKVEIENGTATFFRDGKEVAKASVQAQENGSKFDSTELITNENHTLTGIGFGGTTTKYVITGSSMPAGSNK